MKYKVEVMDLTGTMAANEYVHANDMSVDDAGSLIFTRLTGTRHTTVCAYAQGAWIKATECPDS